MLEGEASLMVDVVDVGANQVQFVFTNDSTSSLTDIYFDDGTLLSMVTPLTDSGAGVSFSPPAVPSNLPNANLASPPFVATVGFTADANVPIYANGVSAGEWVAITFNLAAGSTYADTLAALGEESLRIGVHVQNFPSGSSESFVNNPVPIPEADSYAMMLAGLGLVGWIARRRRVLN